eukprot:CAMPEP_0119389826 /NCGR_PEP_ID=MMETSP1334-20130426/110985_1 /TAXON_ID=127549 /ORGANISM="Calcidiscus leptoporus, Strain RCC1130" /LENGTH=147 /DNA_ID=CAMNT_0007412165 /DNA_START=500 /DNA_END=940 /DNA_ORIENTATION=-
MAKNPNAAVATTASPTPIPRNTSGVEACCFFSFGYNAVVDVFLCCREEGGLATPFLESVCLLSRFVLLLSAFAVVFCLALVLAFFDAVLSCSALVLPCSAVVLSCLVLVPNDLALSGFADFVVVVFCFALARERESELLLSESESER